MAKVNESSLEQENQRLLTLAKEQAKRIKQLEEEKNQLFVKNLLLADEIRTLRKVAGV